MVPSSSARHAPHELRRGPSVQAASMASRHAANSRAGVNPAYCLLSGYPAAEGRRVPAHRACRRMLIISVGCHGASRVPRACRSTATISGPEGRAPGDAWSEHPTYLYTDGRSCSSVFSRTLAALTATMVLNLAPRRRASLPFALPPPAWSSNTSRSCTACIDSTLREPICVRRSGGGSGSAMAPHESTLRREQSKRRCVAGAIGRGICTTWWRPAKFTARHCPVARRCRRSADADADDASRDSQNGCGVGQPTLQHMGACSMRHLEACARSVLSIRPRSAVRHGRRLKFRRPPHREHGGNCTKWGRPLTSPARPARLTRTQGTTARTHTSAAAARRAASSRRTGAPAASARPAALRPPF